MVLVGSDGGELGLREGEGLEVLLAVGHLAPRRDVDHMEARLVAVHRVQDHLRSAAKGKFKYFSGIKCVDDVEACVLGSGASS